MNNVFLKGIFIILFAFTFINSYSQDNPGFFGKKMAIGYSSQFSIINSVIEKESGMSSLKYLTNHDLYFEYAISKYKSLSTHFSYQKVPVSYLMLASNVGDISDVIVVDNEELIVYGKKKGYSDFRYLSIGLKYNLYIKNKTISAPSGLSYYFRFDVNIIKPLNNNYYYDLSAFSDYKLKGKDPNDLIDRDIENTSSVNYSLGMGIDNKFMLSKTLYFKENCEFNLSSVGITQAIKNGFFVEENTVKRDLKSTGQGTNRFRNMFLLGIGVGMLL